MIGLRSKAGRCGGIYAYAEISFEFDIRITHEFKIYLVMEFERLKTDAIKQLGWDIKWNLVKIIYRIHCHQPDGDSDTRLPNRSSGSHSEEGSAVKPD